MSLPTPDDLGRVPVWRNYIVAQAVQASLGLIPSNALAVGVEIDGLSLRVRFQLSDVTDEDIADMNDIVDELQTLVGDNVDIELVYDVLAHRAITPSNGVSWIFLAR